MADFNGDGIPDLVTLNNVPAGILQPGSLNVLLGNGDGTFTLKSSPTIDFDPFAVVVADFNGDGIPDLATVNYWNSTVSVLLGNGDGTFTAKSSTAVGSQAQEIAVGDFNGDGIETW